MRVLVISHNVFSNSDNMGRTLASFFKDWNTEDVAQLYFHSERPNTTVCENYYCITDKQMVKSIFTRKSGYVFRKNDVDTTRENPRTDTGLTAELYQKGRERTPLIYFARNLIWKFGKWNTSQLNQWLERFNPEVVFFASGDYAFSYEIAKKIATDREIPLVLYCVDDFYFTNRNENVFLGKLTHKAFLKCVRKTMKVSSAVLCICDKMSKDYQEYFKIPCYTLHTVTSLRAPLNYQKKIQISFLGNLSHGRYKQIVKIGSALKKMDIPGAPHCVTVYSGEKKDYILKEMTPENGINFMGRIPQEEVNKVMGESLAVIHTESFDKNEVGPVMYSVSTKIADSLMSGTCLFAFGPKNVASMEYLTENKAAVVANSNEDLQEKLRELFLNMELRRSVEQNAIELAIKNHTNRNIRQIIDEIIATS